MTTLPMQRIVTFVYVVVTHVNDNDRQSLMSSYTHCVSKTAQFLNVSDCYAFTLLITADIWNGDRYRVAIMPYTNR